MNELIGASILSLVIVLASVMYRVSRLEKEVVRLRSLVQGLLKPEVPPRYNSRPSTVPYPPVPGVEYRGFCEGCGVPMIAVARTDGPTPGLLCKECRSKP